jgi:hypothetical protein
MTSTAPDRPRPLFRRIRRAWADAPAVVRVVSVAALLFAWLTALDVGEPSEGTGTIVVRAVVAVVVGGAMVGGRWIRRRTWPDAPREVEVSEAAEDGELPPGADTRSWLGALDRRRREIRQEAWSVPILLVVVVAVVFLPPVRPDRDLVYIVFLAVFVAWATTLITSRSRRRDAVDALLIPLQERSSADAARRAGWPPPMPDDRIPPAAG